MKTKQKETTKIITTIIIATIIILNTIYTQAASISVTPTENQYLELRATTINTMDNQDKQIIFELWGHDIEFKGFDVRFTYDTSQYTPSNIETNAETEDETEFFKFENEFTDSLELFTIPYDGQEKGGMRAIISFNPPVTETEHIKNKENVGMIVDTGGDVLIGKMSFKMNTNKFDISSFKLETSNNNSPKTGIKINVDGGKTYYEAQTSFRFTDKTESKDADLSNIILSKEQQATEEEQETKYKEYEYTPKFDKNTQDYELSLLEYMDSIDLIAIKSDEKSTLKLKITKRDEKGNAIKDENGNITYEEKDITSGEKNEIILNKIGEEDTQITIEVTAEDTRVKKEYHITIKKPYGTIKGNIKTLPTESTGIYKATIRIYKSEDVSKIIDWGTVENGKTDTIHEQLLELGSKDEDTKDDGTYEIYVIPGTYDILLDKAGYLDHIYTKQTVNEGETIDLGEKELKAGDINKDRSSANT